MIEVPFSFIFPFGYTAIFYYISGFNPPAANFFKFGKLVSCHSLHLALVLINLTFSSTGLGILLGSIINEMVVALNMAPLIWFSLMFFCGYYVNTDSLQDWIKWFEYSNPIRYGYEALVYNEFEGTNYSPNPINTFNFTWGYWSC